MRPYTPGYRRYDRAQDTAKIAQVIAHAHGHFGTAHTHAPGAAAARARLRRRKAGKGENEMVEGVQKREGKQPVGGVE